MRNFYKVILVSGAILSLFGCASLPLLVEGDMPPDRPVFIQAYEGDSLSKDKTSMLVGAKFKKQTAVYIIGIDGKKLPSNKGLIGGPEAVVVLPGTHDINVQFHDKGRMTIPLDLPGVTLDAGAGYLIDFKANFPPSFDGNFNQLSAVRIDVTIVNLDTRIAVYQRTLNGWGKEVNSPK